MTINTCPLCGGTTRYLLETDGDNGQLHLSGTFKNVRTETYVCGDCRHVERYVTEESMPLLRERAVRVV